MVRGSEEHAALDEIGLDENAPGGGSIHCLTADGAHYDGSRICARESGIRVIDENRVLDVPDGLRDAALDDHALDAGSSIGSGDDEALGQATGGKASKGGRRSSRVGLRRCTAVDGDGGVVVHERETEPIRLDLVTLVGAGREIIGIAGGCDGPDGAEGIVDGVELNSFGDRESTIGSSERVGDLTSELDEAPSGSEPGI